MTTIRQPDTAGNSDRLITMRGASSLRNVTLDGRREQRGQDGWNLEQSACIFIHGTQTVVEDVNIVNPPGDGITVWTGQATLRDINVTNGFWGRGGVTVNGPNTDTLVERWTGDRIQIELAVGYEHANLTVRDSHPDRFTLQAWAGSLIDIEGSETDNGIYLYAAGGGTVDIRNCTFRVQPEGPPSLRFRWAIRHARDVTFTNCVFDAGDITHGLELRPQNTGHIYQNTRLTFVDCHFIGQAGGRAVYDIGEWSVDGHPDPDQRDNQIVFDSCTREGLDAGYVLRDHNIVWPSNVTGDIGPA